MSRQVINTHNAPAPGGSYSQGIRVGDEIFVAGSGPYDPATHEIVPGGIGRSPALVRSCRTRVSDSSVSRTVRWLSRITFTA